MTIQIRKDKKGFSLMEITAAMLIIGTLAAIAIPTYTTSTEQAMAKAAEYNINLIYITEQTYRNQNGNYCYPNNVNFTTPFNPLATSCGTLPTINTGLNLNINDNNYTYVVDPVVYAQAYPTPKSISVLAVRNYSNGSSVDLTWNISGLGINCISTVAKKNFPSQHPPYCPSY